MASKFNGFVRKKKVIFFSLSMEKHEIAAHELCKKGVIQPCAHDFSEDGSLQVYTHTYTRSRLLLFFLFLFLASNKVSLSRSVFLSPSYNDTKNAFRPIRLRETDRQRRVVFFACVCSRGFAASNKDERVSERKFLVFKMAKLNVPDSRELDR